MNELCNERHERIDTTLKEHGDKLDKLSVDNAKNQVQIADLCKQLGTLSKSLWGLTFGIALATITAIINFVVK